MMFLKWHTELLKWTHQVATHFQLFKSPYEKSLLTDTELLLLYQTVATATTGVDNSLQHYNAWLLSWGTGAWPGSLTVAQGYCCKDTLQTEQLVESMRLCDDQMWSSSSAHVTITDNRTVLMSMCAKRLPNVYLRSRLF